MPFDLRFSSRCLAALMTFVISACIPLENLTQYSRHNIDDGTTQRILPGESTKKDILLLLGEPDLKAQDDSQYAYFIQTQLDYFSLFGNMPTEFRRYGFVVVFDEKGLVTKLSNHSEYLGISLLEL